MNTKKTKVVSVHEGFNFLGFTVKYIAWKCFYMPEKKKVLGQLTAIPAWLKWVSKKYFGQHPKGSLWQFFASITIDGERKQVFLFDLAKVSIARHIKVKGTASPDDPALREYWDKRALCKEMDCGADYGRRRQPKYAAARC